MISHPIFLSIMSANRFSFLNCQFSLDDPDTRKVRWEKDRFAAAREVFDEFNKNCSSALQADDAMAINECLHAFRNQVHDTLSFSQPNST